MIHFFKRMHADKGRYVAKVQPTRQCLWHILWRPNFLNFTVYVVTWKGSDVESNMLISLETSSGDSQRNEWFVKKIVLITAAPICGLFFSAYRYSSLLNKTYVNHFRLWIDIKRLPQQCSIDFMRHPKNRYLWRGLVVNNIIVMLNFNRTWYATGYSCPNSCSWTITAPVQNWEQSTLKMKGTFNFCDC